MTDVGRDAIEPQDEDRLPWLEAVEDEDADDGPSAAKLIFGVLIALLAIGLVIGGVFWLKNRAEAPQGDASLINAPSSPYKVRPDQPGGMKVEGAGDSAYAASEGADANGAIDLSAMPETPVNADRMSKVEAAAPAKTQAPAQIAANTAAPKPVATAKPAPVAVAKPTPAPVAIAKVPTVAQKAPAPAPVAKPVVKAPAPAPVAAPVSGGTIQLGAFSTEAKANAAWKTLSKRFGFLGGLTPAVTPVAANGSTLYRLRAPAGGQAGTICGKLKVAGETCAVVG